MSSPKSIHDEFKNITVNDELFEFYDKVQPSKDIQYSDYSFSHKSPNIKNLDEANKYFNIEDPELVEQNQVQMLKEAFSFEEAKLMGFLNIEFNILNKKMINCCSLCFSNLDKTYKQVNLCVKNCRVGTKQAHKFTETLLNEINDKHEECLLKSRNLRENPSDPNQNFLKCYSNLTNEFEIFKKKAKEEYSNYI